MILLSGAIFIKLNPKNQRKMANCNHCGAKSPKRANFCHVCGKQIFQPTYTYTSANDPKLRKIENDPQFNKIHSRLFWIDSIRYIVFITLLILLLAYNDRFSNKWLLGGMIVLAFIIAHWGGDSANRWNKAYEKYSQQKHSK